MDWAQTKDYCDANGRAIGELAFGGDALAIKLVRAYQDWHRSPLDTKLQNELMVIADDYLRRDVTRTERNDLARRFGHKEHLT